ncbi:cbb3-type cytochrome c oxidase subunit II [Aliifodinibius sp. S!AR15-10]|uniref:cbb3-type cytochrome c oxidase subunit II n=1 Tax=Aliifodinibius sp. S!AR15-10 TaxID=2950437 RepID=UPI0028663458|nr:cbb3-type cytochrome c oxidase subunit II [Aliifodinibius sp. S!AR15-10]MDR8390689.1 cbb3-type cytochrome c oxidase subunit II [Aliifodinibius sp. S!AR15-10]
MKLNFHKNHKLLFGVVFWGFIFLSLLIAVFPALWVQQQNEPLPASEPMTELQQKGLNVFISEGCVYCHTQQVRPIEMDENWGRPSAPGDYARIGRQDVWRQTPAVLGSERTGPDLSNVGQRQPSAVWHYMHLYNPRSVVEESIMPSYPWLFSIEENPSEDATVISMPGEYGPEEGQVVATERAEALVAYMQSLDQVPMDAEPTAAQQAKADSVTARAARKKIDGATIYANNCASCHQQNGQGVQGAFPPLAGDPVVTDEDPTDHIRVVLYGMQGIPIEGTEYQGIMQPFGEMLSDEEVAAVINHERTSWGNDAPTVTAEDVAKVRNSDKLNKITAEE